jgi:hypothetical protein
VGIEAEIVSNQTTVMNFNQFKLAQILETHSKKRMHKEYMTTGLNNSIWYKK